MSQDRSIKVGGDASANVFVTGDKAKVTSKIDSRYETGALVSVDMQAELTTIREILERIGGENAGKIGRAIDDAIEEANKPDPDKDEVGVALDRAINYAKKSGTFAEEIAKLGPHIVSAVTWLGQNWSKLLPSA